MSEPSKLLPVDCISSAPQPEWEGKARVLLVDDQRITGIMLGKMLVNEPGTVLIHCLNPLEAVETARRVLPAVILMDVVMPGIDGIGLLERFRNLREFDHTPLVMLSVNEDPEVKARCFEEGANDYLIKLPESVEMLARLRYHAQNFCNFQSMRRAEQDLRAVANRFQLVTRSVHDAIITTDLTGRITFWNFGAERIFGLHERQALGMMVSALMPERYHERWCAAMERMRATGVSSLAGRTVEFIGVRKNQEEFPLELSLTRLEDQDTDAFVAVIRDITERKQAEERIYIQANYDALTGLANRPHFLERLRHNVDLARRQRTGFALVFIDLDRFKWVNDTLGHAAGDELLKEVARRLVEDCVRKSDTVGRLGGDEFTAILYGITERVVAGEISGRILGSLAEPFCLEGVEVKISGSVGITFFPSDGEQPDELMRNADMAMYVAKHSGKNRFWFFAMGEVGDGGQG